MLRKQQWFILLACVFALFFISSVWAGRRVEAFEDMSSQALLNQLNMIATDAGEQGPNGYKTFLAYVYQYPEKSSDVLMDIKKRAFTDKCMFRKDWKEEGAGALGRPMGGVKPEEATAGYNMYIQCLADGTPKCKELLADLKRRLFVSEDACQYRVVESGRDYSRGLQAKFQ